MSPMAQFLITWLIFAIFGFVLVVGMKLFFSTGESYEDRQNRIRKQIEDENL